MHLYQLPGYIILPWMQEWGRSIGDIAGYVELRSSM